MIDNTAKILKALGEPTRLKIIKVLAERELCICELVAVLNMSQPRISQHVKVLKQARLLVERKSRQNSYLSINRDVLQGTRLAPFHSLMEVELADLADMQQENQRFRALESNEDVIACKSGVRQPDEEIANSI